MKYPTITPAIVATYHSLTDQFVFVIDLCETTVTAYDTNPDVKARVDFVEATIDAAGQTEEWQATWA